MGGFFKGFRKGKNEDLKLKKKPKIPEIFEIGSIGAGLNSPYAGKVKEIEGERKKYAKDILFTFYGVAGIAMNHFSLNPKEVKYEPTSRTLTISRNIRDQIKSNGEELKKNLRKALGIEENELVEKLEDFEKRLGIEKPKES